MFIKLQDYTFAITKQKTMGRVKIEKNSEKVARTINFDNIHALNVLTYYALITHNLTTKQYIEKVIREQINSKELQDVYKKAKQDIYKQANKKK